MGKHTKFDPYQCQLCDSFSSRDLATIQKHFKSSHSSEVKQGLKSWLLIATPKLDDNIKRIHIDEKFQCTMCTLTFYAKEMLQVHYEYCHLYTKVIKCPICKFTGKKKDAILKNIFAHIQRKHAKIHRFLCRLCNHRTFHLRTMESHLKLFHYKESDETRI